LLDQKGQKTTKEIATLVFEFLVRYGLEPAPSVREGADGNANFGSGEMLSNAAVSTSAKR
jgi:hypothetical protein